MTVTLSRFNRGYGATGWQLESSEHGTFYLGQDAKVASRTLGFRDGFALAEAANERIGREDCLGEFDDLTLESVAGMILEAHEIEEADLELLDPWSLAVE